MLMFGVDLLLASCTLFVISVIFHLLGSSQSMSVSVFYQITVSAFVVALTRFPFSRWIFPKWFSATMVAKKRARLKDWRYWNKSPVSHTLQNEAWFHKPK